jgi:hypothetical protein
MFRDQIKEMASADSVTKKFPELKFGPLLYLRTSVEKETGYQKIMEIIGELEKGHLK